MGLPVFDAEWFGLGAAEKIRRFNAAGTTLSELESVATPEEVAYMLANNFSPAPESTAEPEPQPAPSDPIADLASELGLPKFLVANYINAGYSTDEVRNIFAPPPAPPEPPTSPEPPSQPPSGPTAEEIAAQQKAAADSQQRSKYGMTTDEFRSRLMAGSPSDLLVDQRLLEITLEKGWTPQLAVEIVNTTFGTNKTVSDYTTAMSKVLQDPITKLVQNGSTASEVAAIGKQIGIDDTTLNAAISTAINTKAAEDIVKGVTALVPAGQSLGYDAIVKYADDNKLAYADVANALKSTFKDTTSEQIVNSMVYEKDRQQIDSIAKDVTVNGKTSRSVALPDAIALAISKGIETDNLAKFFGKTPAEFKTMVSDNLGSIASAVNKAGVDASIGLSDLLGISKDTTNAAVRRNDLQTGINSLAVTKDGKSSIPLDKAFEFAATNKLGDEELGSLIGMSVADITKARDTIATSNQLNALRENDGKLTFNEILGVADAKKMSLDDFVKNYLGNDQQTLTSLKAEAAFSPQERSWRESLPFDPTKIDQVSAFQTSSKLSDADMERVFGVAPKALDTYRVTSAMNQYAGEDKQLSYSELAKFAEDNKMDLSKVVSYLGTDDTRPDILKGLQAYVADSKLAPQERLTNQLNLVTKEGTASGTWDKNQGWTHHVDKMTNYLTGLGIDDLSKIGTRIENRQTQEAINTGSGDNVYTEYQTVTVPHVVYYDKTTGKELQAVDQRNNNGAWEFGSEGEGKGSTGYILAPTKSGDVGVTSQWREKYGVQEYAMPVAFIAAVAAPYLIPELVGGVVGGVELAALGGEMAVGTGLTGSLMAAGIPASVAPYAASAIVNGMYQGTVAEATGGDFNQGFVRGLAPVFGQLTSNAINTVLSDLQLPAGVDKAAGNAMMQLISTGKIDPAQMLVAGVTPAISSEIQKATGLNAAQTQLVLNTVISQGKNLQALTNPATAINFVIANQGVFDKLGTSAATGTTGATKSDPVDLGAFNESQVNALQGKSTDGTQTGSLSDFSFVDANGSPASVITLTGQQAQDVLNDRYGDAFSLANEILTGNETASIPGGSITIIQGKPQVVIDPATGQPTIRSEDFVYAPVIEYYQGPNGTVYQRDLRDGTVYQLKTQTAGEEVLGGRLVLDPSKVQNLGAVISGLPPDAKFLSTAYTNDIMAAMTPKASLSQDPSSYLMTEAIDPSIKRPENISVTKMPDGTEIRINKITGDTAKLDKDGNVVDRTLSTYTKFNNGMNAVLGTTQVGIAELAKNYTGFVQQLQNALGFDTTQAQKLIDTFADLEARGRTMRPEDINKSADKFVQDVYNELQSAAAGSEAAGGEFEVTAKDQGRAILNSIKNNPVGAFTLFGEELVQSPELLLPGGVTKLIGSFVANVAESSGAQALQKVQELKDADIKAGKTPLTDKEYINLAAKDAAIAGSITAALSLVPGANSAITKPIKEAITEYIEEYAIARTTGASQVTAATNGLVGSVLGGKVAASSEAGQLIQNATAQKLGVTPNDQIVQTALKAGQPTPQVVVSSTKLPTTTDGYVPPSISEPSNLGNLPTTTPEVPSINFAVLGDSLSSTLGYDETGKTYGTLESILGDGTTNVSRGGMTTEEALTGTKPQQLGGGASQDSAFAPYGGTFESFLNSQKPGTVVLRYGAADAAILKDPAKTLQNIETMINMAKSSGAKTVLVGIPPVVASDDPRHGGVASNYYDFMPPLVSEINQGIKNLATKYNLQFVDLSQVSLPKGSLLDGLHPDQSAGSIIANEIKNQLTNSGNIPTSTVTTTAPSLTPTTQNQATQTGQTSQTTATTPDTQTTQAQQTTATDTSVTPTPVTTTGTAPTTTQQGQTGAQTTTPEATVTTPGINVDQKPFIDVEEPSVPTPPQPTVPPFETIFQPTTPGVTETVLGETIDLTPSGPGITSPTTPIQTGTQPSGQGAKPPVTQGPQFPSIFFPWGQSDTNQIDFGYPNVPPPELSGTAEMPYPNYLRPLEPYLPMGLAALMESYYAQKPGNGDYQSFENAGPKITIPT